MVKIKYIKYVCNLLGVCIVLTALSLDPIDTLHCIIHAIYILEYVDTLTPYTNFLCACLHFHSSLLTARKKQGKTNASTSR
jgi:hypothetical protein